MKKILLALGIIWALACLVIMLVYSGTIWAEIAFFAYFFGVVPVIISVEM